MKYLAWDTECTGVDLYHGAMPYIVTMYDGEENIFWEWDVNPITRSVEIPIEDLKEINVEFGRSDIHILQNPVFDFKALEAITNDIPEWSWRDLKWDKVWDTLMAGHLMNSVQAHDLASMVLIYLRSNIQPYEDAVKAATQKARGIARSKLKDWRIAKEDLPDMPSVKGSSKKQKSSGVETNDPWKADMWLPKAMLRLCPELVPDVDGWSQGDDLEKHPWNTVTLDYANCDSEATYELMLFFQEELTNKGHWNLFLERMKILSVQQRMEDNGIVANVDRMDELYPEYQEESRNAAEYCLSVAEEMGYELSLPKRGLNNSLRHFLFGEPIKNEDGEIVDTKKWLDLPVVNRSKKTGAPSFSKHEVEEYVGTISEDGDYVGGILQGVQFEFVKRLSEKSKRDTAVGYMDSYKKFWQPLYGETQQRRFPLRHVPKWAKSSKPIHQAMKNSWMVLHPNLKPCGTSTLRWSSSSPNEQNISKKEGFNLRYIFGPPPGYYWASLDYNNIELRIPAYESGEQSMIELFESPDEPPFFGSNHLVSASIVFPDEFWPLSEQKGAFQKKYKSTLYQRIKNFNFAVQYGAVPESGTADRAAGVEGAQLLVMKKLGKLTELNQYWIDFANEHGYVTTMPDKEVSDQGYPVFCSRSKWGSISPTIPFNYHIQSTAMWCTSRAMVKCQEYLDQLRDDWSIALQVHDEIVFQFPKTCNYAPKLRKLKKIMESIGNCIGVPLTVGVDVHVDNWSEEMSISESLAI